MSPPSKRLRQISIFESFSINKKQKIYNSNMSDSSEIRDHVLAAAEKRLASVAIVSDDSLNSKCPESNDSNIKKSHESNSLNPFKKDSKNSHASNSPNPFKTGNRTLSDRNSSTVKTSLNNKNETGCSILALDDMEAEIKCEKILSPGISTLSSRNSTVKTTLDNKNDTGFSTSALEILDAKKKCEKILNSGFINKKHELVTSKVAIQEDNANAESDIESGIENSAELFPDEMSSYEEYPSSAELFPDERDSGSQTAPDDDDEDSDELDKLAFLNRSLDCNLPLPKLEPLENHSIMFSPHIRPGDAPRPYPSTYRDRWDSDHVRMPCSPQNRYPIETRTGEKRIESRWDLICRSLRREIGSSKDLECAIMKYNSQYADRWNFRGLHAFFDKYYREAEREHFFETILPAMINMALDLPNICTQPVPLLKRGNDHYVTMSQKQIGCLLLNAFFCTFPRRTLPYKRNRQRDAYEYATYPDINFNRLFAGIKNDVSSRNAQKLHCLLNYFRRISSEEPSGIITFHRQFLPSRELPVWKKSTRGIRTAVIKSAGLIESDGQGMLQVDFANKFVGGGVLGHGCVQEEIRFVICPELIVSRLFVECLGFNEVLIVTGVEQYNKYSGYSDNFRWEGNFTDFTPRDSWGRRHTQLVAMDATHFTNTTDQFKQQFITKELNKAYCGFYENALPQNLSAIATGNWGCGAFKGNPQLKFLIQLMAASEAGRSLLYFTFGNKALKRDIQNVYTFLTDKNLAVGDIWRLLENFANNVSSYSKTKYSELYDFIYQCLTKEENYRDEAEIGEKLSLDDSDKRAAEKLFEEIACEDSSTDIEDNAKI